jgi:hypothetical protein
MGLLYCLPGSFGSVRQLVDAIMQYLAHHNLNSKRYVWRAKGEEILAKIKRAWKAALGENKDVTIISGQRASRLSSAYSCSAERYCRESKRMAPAAPRSPRLNR